MFQWFFDEGQRIELQKLIGLGQLCTLGVQVLSKCEDLLFRNGRFPLDSRVDVVDEKVHPHIKFKFFLAFEQRE